MINRFIVLFLSLISGTALADEEATATVSWVAPTTFVTGDPLPAGYLVAHEVCYSIDSTALDTCTLVPYPANTTYVINVVLAPRIEAYRINAAAKAVGVDGKKSDFSNIGTKLITVGFPEMNAPTSFSLSITCVTEGCTLIISD